MVTDAKLNARVTVLERDWEEIKSAFKQWVERMDSVEETLTKKLDSKIEEMMTQKLNTVQAAARDEGGQKGIQDTAGDITKKSKIEVPDFGGKVNPIVFSDWINSMEEYFNWYDMGDLRRVRSTVKLWKMPHKLPGLRADIKNELLRQPIYGVEDVFQAALNAKEYINNQNSKKNQLQIGEVVATEALQVSNNYNGPNNTSQKEREKGFTSNKNGNESVTCFKCGQDGHMAYQCQRRNNLHMGNAQDDEKQQVEDTKENSYDFGVYMADDLEDDEDNFHLSFVRCVLTAPKPMSSLQIKSYEEKSSSQPICTVEGKRKSLNILDKRRARVTTTELPCSHKIATSALQNSRSSFLKQGENDEEQEEAIQ
ncbi:hypothetical protein SLEP1_g30535 [Rubroshorea leprosula]|uniref:CCHC-type domain-containing protein n=1 Tax=Rubroshorea leprosula TaxID=152421 RepID=A0AAV5K0E3_9ROSI|nr:hypothetical protein SLEP1_g30535 [Rubroshorea leprosula]